MPRVDSSRVARTGSLPFQEEESHIYLHKSTLPGQTGLRSQILHCATDLAAPYRLLLSRTCDSRASGRPGFHEILLGAERHPDRPPGLLTSFPVTRASGLRPIYPAPVAPPHPLVLSPPPNIASKAFASPWNSDNAFFCTVRNSFSPFNRSFEACWIAASRFFASGSWLPSA